MAKRGRKKNITSPDELWDLFERYKEETKSKPIRKNDFRGGAAKEVWLELEAPLTMAGFEVFVAKETGFGVYTLKHYFWDTDKAYGEFRSVCHVIKAEIRADQIKGGMAGIYNPSITQRLNNLAEKHEHKGDMKQTVINLGEGIKPEKDEAGDKDNETS